MKGRGISAVALLLALPRPCGAHGDLHEQIEAASKRIANDPGDARLYLKRGELRRIHEEYAAALGDLKRARDLDPRLSAVDLALGKLWLQAGNAETARVELDRFLAKDPDHPDARLHRARALVKVGERRAAVEDYTRALAKHPEPRPEHYIERAQALAAEGPARFDEAIRGIDEGLKRLGPGVTLRLQAVELEVAAKRFDAALARLDEARRGAARPETWLVRRAEILKQAGRAKEAREAFSAALAAIESLPATRRQTRSTAELERRVRAALENSP